ncbi:JAML protein, partial [Mionectes macconnelli]|nr:JAML protein [Mionectes macconnelli]
MVFFYYSNRGVPVGRFKNRVQWEGNLSLWDGSVRLRDLHVNDSGTYECEIRLRRNSSIFKNSTVLHVSPPARRGACCAPHPLDSGFWPAVAGCGCVAVVVAFLAGLCVRKRYQTLALGPRVFGDHPVPNIPISPLQEALYCSIPGAEIPKAEQDAKKKRRAEDTYITMHPSHCRENGVYVELSKRMIPAEWMGEGRQGGGQSQEPHSRPEEPLPWAPEQGK